MEGREVVCLGGVGHGELSEVFFGLTIVVVTKFILTRGFWVFLINVLEMICRSCR